jgi:hypothetical protein
MLTNGMVDNNDGISIIDITDPLAPRYCMMFLWEAQAPERYLYRPLSAKEYVECYYPFINLETSAEQYEAERIRKAYEGLLSIPLIDVFTVVETWPEEYREDGRAHVPGSDDSDPETDMIDKGPEDEEKKKKIPSLATMTIFKAVQTILQDADNADQIDFLLQLPMGQESINAVTASLTAESQLPDYILPVLAKVLTPLPIDGYMDLSQFALSGNQICQVTKLIPTCKILKLGGRIKAEIDEIVDAIKCLPDLDTVMLFDDLVSVEQLAHLRQGLPSDRIRIAHRKEYFNAAQNRNLDGPQYTRPNVPDFVFIVDGREKWGKDKDDPTHIRGVGVEVLDDPNFIIQTVRDFLRVEYRFDAATIGLSMHKREYDAPFMSSAFVSIASPKAQLERENPDRVQWGFVSKADDYPRVLKYGFFRYQYGSPLQVMDVDGFVTALSKERPDLPPVTSGSDQPEDRFTSFLDEVHQILGTQSEDQAEKVAHSRWASGKPNDVDPMETPPSLMANSVADDIIKLYMNTAT